jgi:hypothetical protein
VGVKVRTILIEELDFIIAPHTGTGGNQVTDNHVFLQSPQAVNRSGDGRIGEDPGVSWKDAAEIKLSMFSDARVIPSSSGRATAG